MFNSLLYKKFPRIAQEWMLSGRSYARGLLREGASFRELSAEIDQSQWLTSVELAALSDKRLRAALVSAGADVPYYRNLFAGIGFSPSTAKLPEDLCRLPMLAKSDIRQAGTSLVSELTNGVRVTSSTSGTTGSPLSLYQNLHAINREHAFIWRQLTWAGLKPGDRRAWIRGEMIVPADTKSGPYWRENRADRMLMMSSFHLSDASAKEYIAAISSYNPVVIQAYPSSITFLAAWMENNDIKYTGPALRGIMTSSETFTVESRELVSRRFGCPVFDWYGLAERVAAIGTCDHGHYHLMSDYSYVELSPQGEDGYELCGTAYNNPTMPLIRYQCGDLVRLPSSTRTCSCGRAFPLVEEIIGRADDAIKLPDGRRIAACLAGNVFRGVPGILQGQIRQDHRDRIDLFVVPTPSYSAETVTSLRANVESRIGRTLSVDIHPVEELPRTSRGKFKAVVCTI